MVGGSTLDVDLAPSPNTLKVPSSILGCLIFFLRFASVGGERAGRGEGGGGGVDGQRRRGWRERPLYQRAVPLIT